MEPEVSSVCGTIPDRWDIEDERKIQPPLRFWLFVRDAIKRVTATSLPRRVPPQRNSVTLVHTAGCAEDRKIVVLSDDAISQERVLQWVCLRRPSAGRCLGSSIAGAIGGSKCGV